MIVEVPHGPSYKWNTSSVAHIIPKLLVFNDVCASWMHHSIPVVLGPFRRCGHILDEKHIIAFLLRAQLTWINFIARDYNEKSSRRMENIWVIVAQ